MSAGYVGSIPKTESTRAGRTDDALTPAVSVHTNAYRFNQFSPLGNFSPHEPRELLRCAAHRIVSIVRKLPFDLRRLQRVDDFSVNFGDDDLRSFRRRKQDEEAFRDLDKLLAMARRPNVAVKASALPCYTTDPYPYRRLHPYIRRVYDAFGPQRMFWGSDMSRLPCTYRQAITMFTEEMPWFSTDDLDWIMGRGLSE